MKKGVQFHPFQAYRPINEKADALTCPPYNVTNHQEAMALAQNNPLSFLHVLKAEVDCDCTSQAYDLCAARKGKEFFEQQIDNKFFIKDTTPSFYLYEQSKHTIKFLSIIGLLETQTILDGYVKKHEQTILLKEKALAEFTKHQQAQVDPILLTYKDSPEFSRFLKTLTSKTPTQQFTSEDGAKHSLWKVDDEKIRETIQHYFAQTSTLYLADGHHRCGAAQQLHPSEPHLLSMLISASQVKLLNYDRIIKDLNGLTENEFIAQLKTCFNVTKVASSSLACPQKQGHVAMLLNNTWYKLKLNTNEMPNALDITHINNMVLYPLLGIKNLNQPNNIEYVGGHASLDVLQQKCQQKNWQLAFSFFPVSIQQFTSIIDAGHLMPPKTTWIEPKSRPGLVVYKK